MPAIDRSTYGRVRFHHSSTQEYLTAAWLDRLLQANCPLAEIWDLIFAERYGVKTVVPSLRPVAAWLARWRPAIRSEIIIREPLVLMRLGDPGSLSLEVKEALLECCAAKRAASEVVRDRWDSRSLWMFADQRLAPAIQRVWSTYPNEEFQDELLRLVRDGAIKECGYLARDIALDTTVAWHRRVLALHVLAACKMDIELGTAARSLVSAPSTVDARMASSFASVLFPTHLSVEDVLSLIQDTIPVPKGSTAGFGNSIEDLCNSAQTGEDRTRLIAGLTDLCLSPPFTDSYRRVSDKYRFLAKQMHAIARAELRRHGGAPPTNNLVRLLMVTERTQPQTSISSDGINLHDLVRLNRPLSHALFWSDIEDHRKTSLLDMRSFAIGNFMLAPRGQLYGILSLVTGAGCSQS